MSVKYELWDDAQPFSSYEILGSILKDEFSKETVIRRDLSYLNAAIREWWSEFDGVPDEFDFKKSVSSLKLLILATLNPDDLIVIQRLGHRDHPIAAVLFDHVFDIPDKTLAHLVHEAFTEIAGIVDIKYPYEEHKELFPKDNDLIASDWGKGLGIIRPHSDDIYEHRDINAMCLTVCKDTSSTPTWFWLLKDVVSCLSDEELGRLALADATFSSGTNVEGVAIQKRKPILRKDFTEGLTLRLDFRIDDAFGPRMRFDDPEIEAIVQKLREGFRKLKPLASTPSTGSVGILSNFKILHGRSALNPTMLYDGESSRVLFRSKGLR